MTAKPRSQLGYFLRATAVMARDPVAAVERIGGRLDRRRDNRALRNTGLSIDELYPVDPDWLPHLHEALGYPLPCGAESRAQAVYAEVRATLVSNGIAACYGGWADGGPAFTRVALCLCLHLRPQAVIETGVARGVTTRFVLEALEQNEAGRLASIDLPSVDSRFHDQIGIAVPERLRDRWSYISGTSRQRLPGLLAELGEIDFFIHDSLHTGANTSFELENAWNVLRPGGAMLVDDVYQSLAFRQFVASVQPAWSTVAANADGSYCFGIVLKGSDLAETLQGSARSAAIDATNRTNRPLAATRDPAPRRPAHPG
jgi:hypothetical protein